MKAFLALMKREYLEHKGAFLYAPAVLLAVLTVALVGSVVSGPISGRYDLEITSGTRLFEIGFMMFAGLWWLYLVAALIFYFAGAFSADKRNNAMLFWKSMPVSDLRILMTKFVAGLTQFPAMVLVAVLGTGLLLVITALIIASRVPGLSAPELVPVLTGFLQVSFAAISFYALALLWYAPFFAWIAALATVVGRWSIPLAILTPAIVSLAENIVFFGRVPAGGYVGRFLMDRLQLGPHGPDGQFELFIIDPKPFEAWPHIATLLGSINWVSMAGGLVVAGLLLYAASEYRRRTLNG